MMQGMLGRAGRRLAAGSSRRSCCDRRDVEPIAGRPGAALPPADFAAAAEELAAQTEREPRDEDVLSYLLYPQVFLDSRSTGGGTATRR